MNPVYLMYVDESGRPERQRAKEHFILLGIAIPAYTWQNKAKQISDIKSKYNIENKEIHTAWMLRPYPEQKKIPNFEKLSYDDRRKEVHDQRKISMTLAATRSSKAAKSTKKNHRNTDAYIHLTFDQRKEIVVEIAKLINSWTDCRLFAEAVELDSYDFTRESPFEKAFTQVVARFDFFLQSFGMSKDKWFNGLIIQDNNDTEAKRLTRLMRRLYREGTPWREVRRIIETPLFVDSSLTEMVQMADLCAYATRRYFEKDEKELFEHIYSRFDRSANSAVVGINHYTSQRRCNCDVCNDHRGPIFY